MYPRPSTLIVTVFAVTWTCIAGVSAIGYWKTAGQVKPVANRISVTKALGDFQSHYPSKQIAIDAAQRSLLQTELFDPEALLPSPEGTAANTMALKKLRAWLDYKRKRATEIPTWVWRDSPLIHPQGGSWAKWLNSQGYKDRAWLISERKYLHILETGDLPQQPTAPLLDIVSRFSPELLQRFIKREPLIVADDFVLVTGVSMPDGDRLQIYSRANWDKFMSTSPIQLATAGTLACDYRERSYCWNLNPLSLQSNDRLYFLAMMISLIGMVMTVIAALALKIRAETRSQSHQQLIMQTLTHELRHPVTGLKLSLEAFRENYDDLPNATKSEFLRLDSITARLNRLVNVSRQYLKLVGERDQFAFQNIEITSLNGFLESVLDPYGEKIELRRSGRDCRCSFDGYWVSTCILNLVQNALIHGKAPIEVSWTQHHSDIAIVVQDRGAGPNLPISELTKPKMKESLSGGMGLGLSLVNRLMSLMGGSLTLGTAPTRFTLLLKGVVREQSIAS